MRKHWQALQPYVLYFILYAIIGWLYEVFLEVVVYRWGYSDRGVLFGPWCPVYGVGAMAFLVCVRPLMTLRGPGWFRWAKPFLAFLSTMAVATGIELAASYFLESLTGGWPWQTYADYAVNFQGRIALSPSIRFGLGGVIFLYVVQPLLERLVGGLPERTRSVAATTVLVVLLADCGATVLKLLLRTL